jgi:hypothetical protein
MVEISFSHGVEFEDESPLGCDAVQKEQHHDDGGSTHFCNVLCASTRLHGAISRTAASCSVCYRSDSDNTTECIVCCRCAK